ncbi:MAG TPA: hypothetical protein VK760_12700 [Candidatus Acidoferrales bacterium]|jgi:hypothetical protein|nr:hypothetical protein [Candidatus Acidoferrales bacterium]
MKRLWTPLAIGFAALAAFLLAPSMGALAGQQTFSSVSTGWGPAPGPTATSMTVSEGYLNLYPSYWPYHWYPCSTGHCHPVRHPVHPVPGHPIAPRPVPPRP